MNDGKKKKKRTTDELMIQSLQCYCPFFKKNEPSFIKYKKWNRNIDEGGKRNTIQLSDKLLVSVLCRLY